MSSSSDRKVLNAIFNPLLVEDGDVEDTPDRELAPDIDHHAVGDAKINEANGISLAESGDLDGAIAFFTKAIQVCPLRISGYNNRAQAYQLKSETELAMHDLNYAISCAHSNGVDDKCTKQALCQALTQRGILNRLNEQDDAAKSDFQHAAQLGSSFAKTQLIAMNPYAALCNKMLSESFSRLQRGEPEDAPISSLPA